MLNPPVLKKYERHEIDALQKEIEKLARDFRGPGDRRRRRRCEPARNRKLLRLSQANVVLQNWRIRMGK